MQYRVFPFVAVAWSIIGSLAHADGLVFQLPPDGTWAHYAVKTDGEFGLGDGPKQKLAITGTLTISSVGEVTQTEQKCRWIELKWESKTKAVYPKLVLKILIPEDRLQRGKDPLAHARLTFFNPKPVDKEKVESFIDKGFNRIQYEIDRFRDVFPRPLDHPKSLPRETVETQAGKFEDCEVLTGRSDYDGPLLGDGRSVFKATYRIVVHPKAPFGVVSMQIETEGREISGEGAVSIKAKKTLTLIETGKNAASDLAKGAAEKPKK
jgi:hypothetical protein